MFLVRIQCHAAEFFAKSHPILGTFLLCMQCHATKFYVTPCMILHVTEFFATPCLILGTLLHVLKMMAIKSQKLISYTSDVANGKVITTGETTTPSLLDNVFPSINDFFAGDSHVHDLL